MKKVMILFAIVMVTVLIGLQFPQEASAETAGGQVYLAAKGSAEIIHVKDLPAITDLEAKTRSKECGVIYVGPKARTAMIAANKNAIRLFVCGLGTEPYCVTQSGKQVCYPPPR